jgi:integrase
MKDQPYHTETFKKWRGKTTTSKYIREEIIDKIQTNTAIRDKALIAFLYLTGCRISEVIPYKGKAPWNDKEGIRKDQIDINPSDHNRIKILNVRNLKRRHYKCKKVKKVGDDLQDHYTLEYRTDRPTPPEDLYRNIGIKIDQETEQLWQYVTDWVAQCPNKELFKMTKQRAYQILVQQVIYHTNKDGKTTKTEKKGAGINPHRLRHFRFTHLVDIYRLPGQQLRRHAGWANSTTADKYVDSGVEDILDNMTRK